MLKFIFVIFFLRAYNSLTDQEIDNKNRLIACTKLFKAALRYDEEFLLNTVKQIKANDEVKDMKELESKVLEEILLTCYSSLPLIKSAEFVNKQGFEGINPKRKENNVYISYDKYKEKYSKDLKKLEKDKKRLQETMKNAQEELSSLNNMLEVSFKEQMINFEEKKNKEPNQNQYNQEAFNEDETKAGIQFGLPHVGFMRKIDPKMKLALGLGLIGLLFFILLLGYQRLTPSNKENRKKKKVK